jgi:hypothetical protein
VRGEHGVCGRDRPRERALNGSGRLAAERANVLVRACVRAWASTVRAASERAVAWGMADGRGSKRRARR